MVLMFPTGAAEYSSVGFECFMSKISLVVTWGLQQEEYRAHWPALTTLPPLGHYTDNLEARARSYILYHDILLHKYQPTKFIIVAHLLKCTCRVFEHWWYHWVKLRPPYSVCTHQATWHHLQKYWCASSLLRRQLCVCLPFKIKARTCCDGCIMIFDDI